MQRLRKDRSFILAEVKGLVLKSDAAQSVDYMNEPRLLLAVSGRCRSLQPYFGFRCVDWQFRRQSP